jgi:hypothetical protein
LTPAILPLITLSRKKDVYHFVPFDFNSFEHEEISLPERDICTKFITPALVQAGWDNLTQIREAFLLQ